jgi:hypothetical protein
MSPLTNAPWKACFSIGTRFRLGLYDPCDPDELPEFIGRVFLDTPDDHLEMAEFIREFNGLVSRDPENIYCIGIFQIRG